MKETNNRKIIKEMNNCKIAYVTELQKKKKKKKKGKKRNIYLQEMNITMEIKEVKMFFFDMAVENRK